MRRDRERERQREMGEREREKQRERERVCARASLCVRAIVCVRQCVRNPDRLTSPTSPSGSCGRIWKRQLLSLLKMREKSFVCVCVFVFIQGSMCI